MKDIEPGCLCLAYSPRMTGPQQCVAERLARANTWTSAIIRHHGKVVEIRGLLTRDAWVVDRLLTYADDHVDENVCDARYIMRIDGDIDDNEKETGKDRENEKCK